MSAEDTERESGAEGHREEVFLFILLKNIEL